MSLEKVRVQSLRTNPQGSSKKDSLSKRKKRVAKIVSSGESSSSESDTPTQPLTEGAPDGVHVQKGGGQVSKKTNETDVREVEGVEDFFPPRNIDATPPLSNKTDKDVDQQTDTDATVGEMDSDYEITPEDATAIEAAGKPSVPASDLPDTSASAHAHREESGQDSVETSREETSRLEETVSEKSNPCREISISVEKLRVPAVQVQEGVSIEPVPEFRTRLTMYGYIMYV